MMRLPPKSKWIAAKEILIHGLYLLDSRPFAAPNDVMLWTRLLVVYWQKDTTWQVARRTTHELGWVKLDVDTAFLNLRAKYIGEHLSLVTSEYQELQQGPSVSLSRPRYVSQSCLQKISPLAFGLFYPRMHAYYDEDRIEPYPFKSYQRDMLEALRKGPSTREMFFDYRQYSLYTGIRYGKTIMTEGLLKDTHKTVAYVSMAEAIQKDLVSTVKASLKDTGVKVPVFRTSTKRTDEVADVEQARIFREECKAFEYIGAPHV